MKLTQAQIAEFEEQGYLFIPEVFSAEEMALLNGELPGIFAQTREEVIREKDSQAPRTAFYVQTWNPVFALLARHPRLVEPGMQLLGSDKLYMHQFKINAKAAFDGAVWQWHQDYATWYSDDDMPTPAARPYGIKIDAAGTPWVACNGSNCIVRVDPETMALTEIRLPHHESTARRLDIADDGMIWYVNASRGRLLWSCASAAGGAAWS